MNMIDFDGIKGLLLNDAERIVREWLPDGIKQGNEYLPTNPTRDDKNPGSFTINLKTGYWMDGATGDKGGDLISLYAYINNIKQSDAAQILSPGNEVTPQRARSKRTPVDAGVTLCLPVPDDAPMPHEVMKIGNEWRKPSTIYTYTDANGAVLRLIYRFEADNGLAKKEFRPLTCWRDKSGKLAWRIKDIPTHRPLYGLEALARRPDAPVLVVSGEKCVDAVKAVLTEYVTVTWSGGDQGIGKTDFGPLKGRQIVWWPDNDDSGKNAIRRLADKIGGKVINIPAEKYPKGWDCADAVTEGVDLLGIMNSVDREERNIRSFIDDNGKLLIPEFCETIIADLYVKRINDTLWICDTETGAYVSGGNAALGKITAQMYARYQPIVIRQITQAHHYMLNNLVESNLTDNSNMILHANGILDINDWTLHPFSANCLVLNPIPINHNHKAYAPVVTKFLDDVTMNDELMKDVILEGFGASMYRGVFGKAYWLSGAGRNGKSVLLKVFQKILTNKNCSSVPMEFWNEKFKNASLEGKTANIVHEGLHKHIEDTTYIKACIRGESIDIEQKNQPTRTITPYFTSWTASNEMPVIGYIQSQSAIQNRFLIIPFDAYFEENSENDDPDIFEKLTTKEALEYWVLLGMMGLKRLLTNKGKHTYCERIDNAGKERRYAADNIAAWIDEEQLSADAFTDMGTVDMYTQYADYCDREMDRKKSLKSFVLYINKSFRLKSVQARTVMGRKKIFVNI